VAFVAGLGCKQMWTEAKGGCKGVLRMEVIAWSVEGG